MALRHSNAILTCLIGALILTGCGANGRVEQGRVVAYDPQTNRLTLILEAIPERSASPGMLPPVTITTPADPTEIGPLPTAGGLLRLDYQNHRIVIYDRATQSFKTISYTPVKERLHVGKAPGPPAVDRSRKTITVYAAAEHALITFAASDELLAMPADTWRAGDIVRYYYKDSGHALRLMNVTKTDLSKSG
jgi:hypothetical protein